MKTSKELERAEALPIMNDFLFDRKLPLARTTKRDCTMSLADLRGKCKEYRTGCIGVSFRQPEQPEHSKRMNGLPSLIKSTPSCSRAA